MIAVHRARGGIDEPPNLRVPRREQHVEKTVDVRRMRRQRIRDRARHGSQGGLVQDDIDSVAGLAANVGVHDAAFDESMALPRLGAHRLLDLTQVFPMAG